MSDAIAGAKDLCISILEFKYYKSCLDSYKCNWIYVFLYQNLNLYDFKTQDVWGAVFMYFYIRI